MNDISRPDLRPGAEPPEDDSVARLLRLAGPRAAAPEFDAARVKAAAREHWRQAVAARRRRRLYLRAGGGLLAAAALLLLMAGTGFWQRLASGSRGTVARLEASTGRVTASSDLAAGGRSLPAGAVVETAADDPASRAALRLAGGSSVRLDTGTRVRLASATALSLERGAVYVDSGAGAAGPSLEVRTPFGIARDIGTQFEVRLGEGGRSLALRVREGRVVLSHGGADHTAAAGVALSVGADGEVRRDAIPLHGPRWDWILTVLPPFDIEGRSLREFLAWTSREGGWELRFAEDALAERAADTVLHGSITGLTLEQALDALLAGSGLSYRLEGGVLVVRQAAATK